MSGGNPQVPSDRTQQRFDTCQSIDWYAEGESRVAEVGGVHFEVRYVDRKGRRGRIAITAPAGVVFRPRDLNEKVRSPDQRN
jgi:hypothetical protein